MAGAGLALARQSWALRRTREIKHEASWWALRPPPKAVIGRLELRNRGARGNPRKLRGADCQHHPMPDRIHTAADNLSVFRAAAGAEGGLQAERTWYTQPPSAQRRRQGMAASYGP